MRDQIGTFESAGNTPTTDALPAKGIIVFSHLRWSFVWQRPQQFLSRFAARHPVLFIEEPEFVLETGEMPKVSVETAMPNVTTARMQFPHDAERGQALYPALRQLSRDLVDTVNEDGAFDSPLLWFYDPMAVAWALNFFSESGVVYDCMDELSQFKNPPAGLIENEAALIKAADIVFTGGYELWLKKSKQHPNVHFFGCGVEYEHFAQAQDENTEVPEDVRHLSKPVIGWFGVIDERMDYDLLREAAALRPNWDFVLVGPVVKVDPASLPQGNNITWIGQRDYKVLPNYCKSFDICMMPFALNEATEFINPTKALEYLATGRPVISTAVRDVVRQYTDVIPIAGSAQEFISHAERLLQEGKSERIANGIAKARSCSWEATVSKMQQLIEEATAAPRKHAEAAVV